MVGKEILYFKFTEPEPPAGVPFPQRAAIFILRHLNGGSEAEVKGFRWWWESIMGAYVCKQIDVHWFPLWNGNSMEFTDLEPETGIRIPMKSMEFMTSMEFH